MKNCSRCGTVIPKNDIAGLCNQCRYYTVQAVKIHAVASNLSEARPFGSMQMADIKPEVLHQYAQILDDALRFLDLLQYVRGGANIPERH